MMKARARKSIDSIPQWPADCYQVAEELYGVANSHTAALAAEEMRRAGWTFVEYNEYGEEVRQPPAVKLCPACGGSGTTPDGSAWCPACDGQQGWLV